MGGVRWHRRWRHWTMRLPNLRICCVIRLWWFWWRIYDAINRRLWRIWIWCGNRLRHLRRWSLARQQASLLHRATGIRKCHWMLNSWQWSGHQRRVRALRRYHHPWISFAWLVFRNGTRSLVRTANLRSVSCSLTNIQNNTKKKLNTNSKAKITNSSLWKKLKHFQKWLTKVQTLRISVTSLVWQVFNSAHFGSVKIEAATNDGSRCVFVLYEATGPRL